MRLARAAGLARPQRKSPSSSATRPTRHSTASKPPMVQATGRQRPDRGTIDDLRLDPRSAITRGSQLPGVHRMGHLGGAHTTHPPVWTSAEILEEGNCMAVEGRNMCGQIDLVFGIWATEA